MKNLESVADKLGLKNRLEELQFLALDFKGVDLEGMAKFEDELQIFDRETHIIVRDNWEKKLANNPEMFPGPLASVMDFRIMDGILQFRLQRSRFDLYDGLRERVPPRIDLSQKPLDPNFPLPLSMGTVTITAPSGTGFEECIIFGVRSRATAFGKGYSDTLPSGYYNPDSDRLVIGDPVLHKWLRSIRFTTLKELKEEVGIQDYKKLKYLGLVFEGLVAKQPLVAMRLQLEFSAEEVKALAQDIGVEIESYHFVPNNIAAVKEFIGNYPPTPHTVAKLILHFTES